MDITSLAMLFYLGTMSGKLPGMNNVALKPKGIMGAKVSFRLEKLITDFDLYTLYGADKTATGTTQNQFQEIRGKVNALYPLYEHGPESFRVGLYSEFAFPLHNKSPYVSLPLAAYSDEENEIIKNKLLLGADLNFNFRYDKIDSSLHNVFYFSGTTIAPNLLAYKPLYSLDWQNNFYILGDVDNPRLSFSADVKFWFAKKAGVGLINSHDGFGGTKREFDYDIRLTYFWNKHIDSYISAYGYNNLNRGNSNNNPNGFSDGYGLGLEYRF